MASPSTLAEARAAAVELGMAAALGTEDVPLDACTGRIAAADVRATAALPPFASSAMDGWAVRSEDLANASEDAPVRLVPQGEARAGHPADRPVVPGTAARISTGARVPEGADAIVRIEEVSEAAGRLVVPLAPPAGRDVRRAGEDVAAGATAVAPGEELGPGHVALLAGIGAVSVPCRRRPRALVLVTGDEVSPLGTRPGPGGIHDVGGPALTALLRASGAEVAAVRHVGDDRAATIEALRDPGADLVVTCGGASVGPHDHVRPALDELGARALVDGLGLQPGRPTWLGALPGDAGARPVLVLPGNPGAAITVAALLLEPLLDAMAGRDVRRPLRARLTASTHSDPRRVRALRVALGEDDEGRRTTRVLEGQQPHRLASLPATEAFALVPPGTGTVAEGAWVEVVPLLGRGRAS